MKKVTFVLFAIVLFAGLVSAGDRVNRALSIVGRSRGEYQCNHVVNYAIYGNKNIGGLAAGYRTWGHAVSSPQAGVIVVAKDGSHVGIFVSSSEFVHSSSSKYQVIKVSSSQLPYVFPSGYMLRWDGLNSALPTSQFIENDSVQHQEQEQEQIAFDFPPLSQEVINAVKNILPPGF